MIDRETLDKAKALFTGATQGDMLAREVIAIAERAMQKAVLREEQEKKLADYSNPARQTGPYQYGFGSTRRRLGRQTPTAQARVTVSRLR